MSPSEVQTSPPPLSRRAGARLIDALLLAGLGYLWGRPLGFGMGWLVAHAGLVYLYFVASDASFGTTLGKKALGLEVRNAAGELPSFRDSSRRELFVLLGAIPFVGPLLALGFWIQTARIMKAHPQGEGLHDAWAGGTRVRIGEPLRVP